MTRKYGIAPNFCFVASSIAPSSPPLSSAIDLPNSASIGDFSSRQGVRTYTKSTSAEFLVPARTQKKQPDNPPAQTELTDERKVHCGKKEKSPGHRQTSPIMAGQPPRRSSPRQDAKATTNPDAKGVAAATIINASSRPSRSSSLLPRGRARRCSLQSLEDGRYSRSSTPPPRRRPADAEAEGGRTVVVESPPQSRTARSIPTDFPVGGRVTVAYTHARRGGGSGTVRRHTARYVVVAFDDDDGDDDGDGDGDGEIRVSPKFLIPGRIRSTPARYDAPRPRAPVASSCPSAAAAAAAVIGDFEVRRPAMTVRFDMGRNSTAEYDREGPPKNVIFAKPSSSQSPPSSSRHPPPPPPDIVEHLPGEIDDDDDDDVTRRNEEILAEWDELFDDYRHSKGHADSFDERYNNLFFRLVGL